MKQIFTEVGKKVAVIAGGYLLGKGIEMLVDWGIDKYRKKKESKNISSYDEDISTENSTGINDTIIRRETIRSESVKGDVKKKAA